jgi:hypothetical protein
VIVSILFGILSVVGAGGEGEGATAVGTETDLPVIFSLGLEETFVVILLLLGIVVLNPAVEPHELEVSHIIAEDIILIKVEYRISG